MRQQEANQFDKGLNLDTNPITMDNHTLTGALNATMITMNGNELVLLNDMGNGKVDQALLPVGYVPVGMLEYGGIVYVASYNPQTNKSLIGSFPSPQRNIPSTELGPQLAGLNNLSDFINSDHEVENTINRIMLINSVVRPGDKFVITTNNAKDYEDNYKFVRLKVIIVDSDGSSIDITNELTSISGTTYTAGGSVSHDNAVTYYHMPFLKKGEVTEGDYSIYRNRISGNIYLQSELIVPDYINATISALTRNNKVYVTITPHSYKRVRNSEGNLVSEPWSQTNDNSHNYAISWSLNNGPRHNGTINFGDSSAEIECSANDVLHYELWPQYTYSGSTGIISQLKCEDNIEVGLIGNGEVKFSKFRYFNDFANDGQFIFDYNIKAYIDNNVNTDDPPAHTLNRVYLLLYNVEDVFVNGTLDEQLLVNPLELELDTLDYFGSYSKAFNFGTDGINYSSFYIGRLCATTDVGSFESDWYAVLTSAAANQIYFQNPTESMIKILNINDNLRTQITIDWDVDIDRELVNQHSEEHITDDSNLNPIILELPSSVNLRVKYESYKDGYFTYKHTITPKALIENKHFPFDVEVAVNTTFSNKKYSTNVLNVSQGTTTDTVVTSETDSNMLTSVSGVRQNSDGNAAYEYDTIENEVWNEELTDNQLKIDYRIYSQMKSPLKKNPNSSQTTIEGYKFTYNGYINAFVPYLPLYQYESSMSVLENILGPCSIEYTDGVLSSIYPSYWFNYCLNNDDWWDNGMTFQRTHSDKHVGIYQGPVELVTTNDGDSWNAENGMETVNGWISLYSIRKTEISDIPLWNNVCSKINNTLAHTPGILLWYGIHDDWSNIVDGNPMQSHAGNTTYCIPMIKDNTGQQWFVLGNQITLGSNNLLIDIVKSFNSIYVYQPEQNIVLDYWTLDPNTFIYTSPYQLTTSYNVNVSLQNNALTLNSNYGNGANATIGNETLKLPEFVLSAGSKTVTYTDTINSTDLSIINAQFLTETEPNLNTTCAIIIDNTGKHIIYKAKKYIYENPEEELIPINLLTVGGNTLPGSGSTHLVINTQQAPDEIVEVPFNPAHEYLHVSGSGDLAVLIDCQDSLTKALNYAGSVAANPGSWGYKIAKALQNGKLRFTASLDNDNFKICHLAGSITMDSSNKILDTNKYLGAAFTTSDHDRKARVKLTSIAAGHILNLSLFKSELSLYTLSN